MCTIAMEEQSNFEQMTADEVRMFIEEKIPSIDSGVLESITVDGMTFLQLNEEYLRELFPLLGDRIKVKKLINEAAILPPPQVRVHYTCGLFSVLKPEVDSFTPPAPLRQHKTTRKRILISDDEFESEDAQDSTTNIISSHSRSVSPSPMSSPTGTASLW